MVAAAAKSHGMIRDLHPHKQRTSDAGAVSKKARIGRHLRLRTPAK
jgi:hypothetical protein